jgi:hypothetical protein
MKGEHDCPRYVIFCPPPPPTWVSGIKRALRPSGWLKNEVLLFVVCPCCCTAVSCGPEGKGYSLKVGNEAPGRLWVQRRPGMGLGHPLATGALKGSSKSFLRGPELRITHQRGFPLLCPLPRIQVPSSTLVKYAPVIKVTLMLLQLAGMAASGFKVPVPLLHNTDVIGDVENLVSGMLDERLKQALDEGLTLGVRRRRSQAVCHV